MNTNNEGTVQAYLDFSLALALVEVLMSIEIKESVRKLRLDGLKSLQLQLTQYQKLGYDISLLEAIAEKKSKIILNVSTKKELERVIYPRAPHYDGNKFIPDQYSIPEEELICWSETSLKAPLNAIGFNRYMEVFRMVFPEQSKKLPI